MDTIGTRTVRELLEERARLHPEKVALVHESRDGTVTQFDYAELLHAVRRAARGLGDVGVGHGDCVTILLSNSVEFVVTWLGAAWRGAIAVPANTGLTVAELRHVVSLSESRVLVTTEERAVELAGLEDALEPIETWVSTSASDRFDSLESWLREELQGDDLHDVSGDDVAQLVFTSGTSALPKAVMLTHANYLHSGEREARVTMVDDGDRLLTALPLFHVNAQSNTLLAALTVGATAIILEEYSASKFWQQVRRHRATQISLVAMQLRTILAQPPHEDDADHRVRRNIYAINVSDGQKQEFETRFGIELVNGYGLSEAMTVVTAAPLAGERRWPSIGLPAYGRDVRVVDDHAQDVPLGQPGEIIVGGVPGRTLMKGYYRDPAATEAALRGGWLHTGDNGYFDDKGYLYFVDRAKDVIKRAGENISSSEVETVLSIHPSVAECAVVGVPDPVRDEAVKAFVVVREGASVTAAELREHCAASLAGFKVPTIVELVGSLPKTSVGKIKKKVLREEGAP